jgi:uncharacterized protein
LRDYSEIIMEKKVVILKSILNEFKSDVIAFSGRVDSTFLARIAKYIYGENLLLITATSSTYPFYDLVGAKNQGSAISQLI